MGTNEGVDRGSSNASTLGGLRRWLMLFLGISGGAVVIACTLGLLVVLTSAAAQAQPRPAPPERGGMLLMGAHGPIEAPLQSTDAGLPILLPVPATHRMELATENAGASTRYLLRTIADAAFHEVADRDFELQWAPAAGAMSTGLGDLRGQVIGLALAHHLVSAYTSLVAVDTTPARPAAAPLHHGAMPANLPAGWEAAAPTTTREETGQRAALGAPLAQTSTAAALQLLAGTLLLALGFLVLLSQRGSRMIARGAER